MTKGKELKRHSMILVEDRCSCCKHKMLSMVSRRVGLCTNCAGARRELIEKVKEKYKNQLKMAFGVWDEYTNNIFVREWNKLEKELNP